MSRAQSVSTSCGCADARRRSGGLAQSALGGLPVAGAPHLVTGEPLSATDARLERVRRHGGLGATVWRPGQEREEPVEDPPEPLSSCHRSLRWLVDVTTFRPAALCGKCLPAPSPTDRGTDEESTVGLGHRRRPHRGVGQRRRMRHNQKVAPWRHRAMRDIDGPDPFPDPGRGAADRVLRLLPVQRHTDLRLQIAPAALTAGRST